MEDSWPMDSLRHQKEKAKRKEAERKEEEREHWGSRAEFLLSCIGFSVGLGNVWRFPFLAYENGGGAFLIPYVIILVLVGKPMYFMEAALGQFGQVGPLAIWREMLPCAMGVGVAMVILSLIVAIYYNVIMAYCLHYLFNSMRSELPWSSCSTTWGADSRCYERASNISAEQVDGFCVVDSLGGCIEQKPQTSEEQYWERAVLDIDPSVILLPGNLGEIRMDLAFWLFLSWMVVLVCLAKGIRTSGKVVYFTATFPYLILLVLLIMSLTLPGASNGIHYLFVPNAGTWEKLADFQVWRKAASQVFFSLGISWGGIVMFGSYNRFTAPVHIDAHIVSLVDFFTSILASIVIFATLGNSAYELGVPVETVAKGGQGLAFVAYPEALSHLPFPQFWCIIFFLMLFLLGLDSEFALFETVLCAIFDAFPRLRRQKVVITVALVFVCFLMGLPCVTQGGQYVLDIMDTYGASISVLIIAIMEMTFIMWAYGVNNFCKDVYSMLDFTPSIYFKACWTVFSPAILVIIFLAAAASWEKPSYGEIQYPDWLHGIGWALALLSVVQIPLWMVVTTVAAAVQGDVMEAFRPSLEWMERREQRDLTMVTNISLLANSQAQMIGRNDRQAGKVDTLRGFNFY